MTTLRLCSNPNGCCPEVKRKGDVVTITDDYGGKVKMTYEQYLVLRNGVL